MPVQEITSFEQFEAIIHGSQPVVIDFWAPWCGPCRAISPVLDKLSEEKSFVGVVAFYKCNIDDVPKAAEAVGIRVIPTFIAYKDGNKIKEITGANAGALQELVETARKSQ